MLRLGSSIQRNCQGLSRREVLTIGSLGMMGLTLPTWLHSAQAAPQKTRDVSCILLWLDGGPSHLETFDPKPSTPDTVRGPYGVVPTSLSGVQFCELLPMLAGWMNRCAVIRSMTHGIDAHAPIPMLTGFNGKATSYGAVVTRLKGPRGDMPPYVHLGSKLAVGGGDLGSACDPIELKDPTGNKVDLPQFSLSANLSAERLHERQALLRAVDEMRRNAHADPAVEKLDTFHQRAIDMLTSTKVRDAFDLSKEPPAVRNRYGSNFFGQSCLLARRLVEAGTRFVQVKWYDGPAFDAWDVHGADLAGMARMEQQLCPRLDLGLSALLEDLQQRGLLASTLVLAFGEFGRTPKINKYGARDHWPHCFSVFLAGAGIPGGVIVGASDREGAYPTSSPVKPPELAATIYKLMGIDINTDPRVRPFIGTAGPVPDLV